MIHVCYGLYDKTGHYSKFTGTSMLSMFENTREEVTVHIFHDNTLSDANRWKFQAIADKYDQQIKFYNFDEICPEKIQFLREKLSSVFESRFTVGAFYRLMVDKNFFKNESIQKIIYFDSDTVINLDIAKLWEFSMKRYTIAAVPEIYASHKYMLTDKFLINTGKVQVADYFCSGVIILNLESLEENFFYKGVQWLADNPQCNCPDQDILNNFFFNTYRKLPPEFNSFVEIEKRISDGKIYEKIYHYAGNVSLGFDMQNPYDHLFFKYFVKTPWFNLQFIENAYRVMQRIHIECKDFMLKVTEMLSGKERAFFVSADDIETMKKFFSIKDTEEVIAVSENDTLDVLISSMRKSQGKKLFFIMVNYSLLKEKLIETGFVENQDFLDGTLLLSDRQGYELPRYPLLKYL